MAGQLVSDADLTDDDFVFSSEENENYEIAPKVAKSAAKKNVTKKTKVAAPAPTAASSSSSLASLAASDDRPVEEVYQKKTQLEHILLRPDTYIGSVEGINQTMWVYDSVQECMVNRSIFFVPGLFKIFDEILVNAADNKIRDLSMDTVKVDIDRESGRISIFNNGRGIPVEVHAKEGIWVPELIFGHLLTSSNYNDDQKKVTGGRNGYGAKLCNIFSVEFTVETADCRVGKKFIQTFTKNMSHKTEPKITSYSRTSGNEYTKISFIPDYAKFGMPNGMDDDLLALLTKRVYDLAGVVQNVKVFLNGERLKIRNFRQYVELYTAKNEALQQAAAAAGQSTAPLVHSIVNDRWEVCFTLSDGQFQQVSFVNSVNTYKGGTHVTYVADQLTAGICEAVKKKNKAAPVKPFQVRNHLFVFVRCLIENPTFDSQTKENMTLRASAFGSKCELDDDFMKKVFRSGVLENVLSWARFKQDQLLKKTDGAKKSRLSGIAKLDDANNAGTRNAAKCTLILTEGDSAKALAVSGLSVVGRDNWGVFPLRGKLLNVREASHKQIMDNAEINQIKQIMGLQHGKQYDSVESLRYGRLMIMTDQDHDGSHIKGLLINFLDHFWPSLTKIPGFLVEFITPIVRCTRGREIINFYTLPEYEQWKTTQPSVSLTGWTIKYYKGLGTSTAADAKQYFSNLPIHLKEFEPGTDEDRALIDMAFNKRKADDRKEWLKNFVPGTFMNHSRARIPLRDFINHELILFSQADNIRSIPSIMDGLKPGHRKIIFACFKRKLRQEIKIAQLAGYVAEHSAYHHGEQSLCATIIGLAQNFVGSNNLNLLLPNGQFGTRLQGGKDAASPRYIFTTLSPLTRLLFRSEDDALLKYLSDDGQSIEPEWYAPILPLVLINGGEGIGTGWSTSIPNYNPLDLVDAIELLLDSSTVDGELLGSESNSDASASSLHEQLQPKLQPWYRGYSGSIEQIAPDKYRVTGKWQKLDAETLEITELPLGTWTQSYKEFLEGLLTGNTGGAASAADDGSTSATSSVSKSTPFIRDYREYHTDTTVKFQVTLSAANMAVAEAEGFEKRFKLSTTLSLANLVCFDSLGRIRRYRSPLEILLEFFPLRLALYQRRKAHLISQLQRQWNRLQNRVRFVEEIATGSLRVQNRPKRELVQELAARGYEAADVADEAITESSTTPETDSDSLTAEPTSQMAFDYLLNMPIASLTLEKATQLRSERDAQEVALQTLLARTPKDLWRADLTEFRAIWLEDLRHYESSTDPTTNHHSSKAKGTGAKKVPTAKKIVQGSMPAVVASSSSNPPASQSRIDSFLSMKQASSTAAIKDADGDDGDEMNLPLAERINRMLQQKANAASTVNAASNAKSTKAVSSTTAKAKSNATASTTSTSAVATPSLVAKRSAATKRAVIIESDEEDEDAFVVSDESESDEYNDEDY